MPEKSPLDSGQPAPRPALPAGHENHPQTISRNSRIGLVLFAIYLSMYAGFIMLSAFAPQKMSERPFGGVNLAILYGMGLIVGALVLAAVYMYLCRSPRRPEESR